MKDMENIDRLRSGDKKALDRIYDLHCDAFVKSIRKTFGCSKDEATGLFHEVLIKLVHTVENGGFTEERAGGLAGWLYTAGKNSWLQKLKKDGRLDIADNIGGPEIGDLPDDDSDRYDPEIDMLEANALRALERMPDACRRLLSMFYLEEKSLIEIAETLDRSYKAVKKDRWRCIQNLKKIIIP